jgi:hypothetical protein
MCEKQAPKKTTENWDAIEAVLKYIDAQYTNETWTAIMSEVLMSLITMEKTLSGNGGNAAWENDSSDAKKESVPPRRVKVTTVNGDEVTGVEILKEPLIVRSDDTGESVAFESEIAEIVYEGR